MKNWELLLKKSVVFIEIFSLGLIFLSVILQVGCRFILQSPLSWPEELARILFIYLVFIGAAEVSRERSHIAIDLKDVFHLSSKTDHYLGLIRHILVLAVLGIMAYGAYVITPTVYYMNLPATGLSMSVMTIPVLLGSVLMFIWITIHLFRDFLALKQG